MISIAHYFKGPHYIIDSAIHLCNLLSRMYLHLLQMIFSAKFFLVYIWERYSINSFNFVDLSIFSLWLADQYNIFFIKKGKITLPVNLLNSYGKLKHGEIGWRWFFDFIYLFYGMLPTPILLKRSKSPTTKYTQWNKW